MLMFFSSKTKYFLLSALFVALALPFVLETPATAQDVDGTTAPSAPLRAGDLTLEDVIEAHAPHKKVVPPVSPTLTAPPVAAAPQLGAAVKNPSAESTMLMQGLKSVLQDDNKTPSTTLQPPHIDTTATATTAAATPTATPPVAAAVTPAAPTTTDGITYQPGQAPKNLAGAVASATTQTVTAPAIPSTTAAVPTVASITPAATPAVIAAGACTPHAESWTKSCEDAGYPSSFTGEIKGETRTVCPAGNLQDVWVSNSCTSPDGEPAATPAVKTDTSAQTQDALVLPSAAASQQAVIAYSQASTTRIDAACGGANGLAASATPSSDLCGSGEITNVVGSGPWRWSCKGANGGVTVSCAAPVMDKKVSDVAPVVAPVAEKTVRVAEDGACGSSDGVGTDREPVAGLCNKGTTSHVNGTGPWTWACSGINGGTAAACTAPQKIDGVCGASTASGTDDMPMSDLCTAGYASAVTGSGPWNWTCSGINGGTAATCAVSPKRDAVCGPASTTGHASAPHDGLCSVGDASSISGSGPWLWSCTGTNGGAQVSCSASMSVNGSCGAANGASFTEAPENGLCTSGKATRVSGQGPWSWSCVGTDGGDTEGCTASRDASAPVAKATPAATKSAAKHATTTSVAGAELCGPANELLAFDAPTKDLCSAGSPSNVSGSGPWHWTCADETGKTSECSTLAPGTPTAASGSGLSAEPSAPRAAPVAAVAEQGATCGAASTRGTTETPREDLCTVGKASAVHGKGPWSWSCAKGKSKASCEAPIMVDATCGAVNGSVQKLAPQSGLCLTGHATEVQGNGPWLWSCVGTGGGVSVSCSATAQSQARVDGICGAAVNASSMTKPSVNLCDGGVPSNIYGDGPWTWTCSGLNGGIASSCATAKETPAAPPPPGDVVNGLCGATNGTTQVMQPIDDLCAAGTVTPVSGNGPWNWSCLGSNSGMTVSCTALLQPPAPIVGVCGASSGVPTLTTPRSGLCAAGISSAVSGKGPWTWSCSGTNGGGAVACVAPLAGGNGSIPSLVTPSEAPAPHAAPSAAVSSKGLVTPKLSSAKLAPVASGDMPPMPTSRDIAIPSMPPDAEPLTPPALRDDTPPAAPQAASALDDQGTPVPGNHFVLDEDLSPLSFEAGSDIMQPKVLTKLDAISAVMHTHSDVRITLTAYADSGHATPREARRLSLSRALAIRDYLVAKGISSSRVDVRALGANVHSGDPDRVDVKAN